MSPQPLAPLRQLGVHRLQALLGQYLAAERARQVEKRLALHLQIVVLLAETLVHLNRRNTLQQRADVFQQRRDDDQLGLQLGQQFEIGLQARTTRRHACGQRRPHHPGAVVTGIGDGQWRHIEHQQMLGGLPAQRSHPWRITRPGRCQPQQ